jgi:hypothetical protein
MRQKIPTALALALLALGLALPASAAASGIAVIRDCSEDGVLNRHYSHKDLTDALNHLPSDIDEYTDCRSVIRAAQLAAARTGGPSARGPSGVAVDRRTPPSAVEQRNLDHAAGSAPPVSIGGQAVKPGAGAAFAASALGTGLPGWVLAGIVALGASMLAGGAFATQRRWPRAWATAGAAVAGPARRVGEGVRRGIARIRS